MVLSDSFLDATSCITRVQGVNVIQIQCARVVLKGCGKKNERRGYSHTTAIMTSDK